MRENIGKINELLPPIFQLEEDGKELNLYMFGKQKTKDSSIPVKTLSKHLFEGTKKERDAYIEGMYGLADISIAFNDFLIATEKPMGKKNGN